MKAASGSQPAMRNSWRPRARAQRCAGGLDEASQALLRFVAGLPRQLANIGLQNLYASHSDLKREQYTAQGQADRAWRLCFEGYELWCVADEATQRAILTGILGSAPSRNLTAMERSIFDESICRLLQCVFVAGAPKEEVHARPASDVWNCDLELSACGLAFQRLRFYTQIVKSRAALSAVKVKLYAVPLSLRACLPGISISLAEILKLAPGRHVLVECKTSELQIGLFVNGRRLGSGTLGSVLGMRALKLSAVLMPANPLDGGA